MQWGCAPREECAVQPENATGIPTVQSSRPLVCSKTFMARNVACGDNHTLLVDRRGGVWSFGSNHRGQLGVGTAALTVDREGCESLATAATNAGNRRRGRRSSAIFRRRSSSVRADAVQAEELSVPCAQSAVPLCLTSLRGMQVRCSSKERGCGVETVQSFVLLRWRF